jgi:uncharacterized membrane protein
MLGSESPWRKLILHRELNSAIRRTAYNRIMKRWLFRVFSLLGFGVALYAFSYFLGIPFRFPGPSSAHFFQVRHLLYGHVLGGGVAFLTGPWQFSRHLRAQRPRVHRLLGYIYFGAIMLGGVFGLALAPMSMGGPITHLGFGLLAVAWLITGAQAVRLARLGRYLDHRDWVTRSFALTLVAVTLRIYLPLLSAAMPFLTAYAIVSWACWVPNILTAEYLVAGRRRRLGASALRSTAQ